MCTQFTDRVQAQVQQLRCIVSTAFAGIILICSRPTPRRTVTHALVAQRALIILPAIGVVLATLRFLPVRRAGVFLAVSALVRFFIVFVVRLTAIAIEYRWGAGEQCLSDVGSFHRATDKPWLGPSTALLTTMITLGLLVHFGYPWTAVAALVSYFMLTEIVHRVLSSKENRQRLALSFWISMALYLSPVMFRSQFPHD